MENFETLTSLFLLWLLMRSSSSFVSTAFLHSSFYWIAQTAEIDRYIDHPSALPAIAGFTTGALYKSTRGIRVSHSFIFYIDFTHLDSRCCFRSFVFFIWRYVHVLINLCLTLFFSLKAAALAGTIGTGASLAYSYLGPFVYTVILGKGGRYWALVDLKWKVKDREVGTKLQLTQSTFGVDRSIYSYYYLSTI